MKSEQFKFHSQTSSIRGKREEQYKSDATNWGRLVYLILLIVVVGLIVYFVVINLTNISGSGRVIANQITVRAPVDIHVSRLYTHPGKQLQRGDTLFSYRYMTEQAPNDSLQDIDAEKQKNQAHLFDVEENITIRRQKLTLLRQKLSRYKHRKQQIIQEIKLNAETVGPLHRIQNDILETKSDIKETSQQLRLTYRRQRHVQSIGHHLREYGTGNYGSARQKKGDYNRVYRSPVKGNVTNIFKEPLEFAFKAEKIIAIQTDSARVLAKVVFERDDADNLPVGCELTVQFNNGEHSQGIVTKVYSKDSNLESFKNLTGIDAGNKVVVELKPKNSAERRHWRALNGMSLKASKNIF